MNQFFDAIKVDLLDRRRRPILILVLAALVGAVAYAALAGGSSSSSSQGTLGPEPTAGVSGARVTQAQPRANEAVAETTNGSGQQHRGSSRNPFAPLPGAVPAPSKTSTSTATSTTTASTGTGGAGSRGSSGGSSPTHTHLKFKTVYRVAALFGKAAPGTPASEANLKPYENLKLNQLIPSKTQPVVAFRGVIASAKGSEPDSAAFTLVGEAIPRGLGVCKPSTVNCQTLDLKVGQTEELEVLQPNGEVTNYELQLASIVFVTTAKASAASNHTYGDGVSRAGSSLLRHLGLLAMPGLRYSPRTNLLYAPAAANGGARAHSAVLRAR
jgi:hypothetical protein